MLNERGFFPIGDSVRSRSFPLVTVTLIFTNILVFILSSALPSTFILQFAFVPAMPSVVTLFTHMFLHADLFHLLGNMWFFWIFGDNVEDRLGRPRFTLLYFLSGIGAVTLHFILNPTSTVPLVGASGAISGVLGAYILLFPKAKVHVYYGYFMSGNIPAFLYAFIWFGFQLLYGIATLGANACIAFFAHIGGFIAGIILSIILCPKAGRVRV